MDLIRKQGYAVEREEVELGMTCIAAPIFSNGDVIAAISVSGPVSRVTREVQETFIQAVRKTASEITQAIR